jgi:hypothetical protein
MKRKKNKKDELKITTQKSNEYREMEKQTRRHIIQSSLKIATTSNSI